MVTPSEGVVKGLREVVKASTRELLNKRFDQMLLDWKENKAYADQEAEDFVMPQYDDARYLDADWGKRDFLEALGRYDVENTHNALCELFEFPLHVLNSYKAKLAKEVEAKHGRKLEKLKTLLTTAKTESKRVEALVPNLWASAERNKG